jgi:hypothetical protein
VAFINHSLNENLIAWLSDIHIPALCFASHRSKAFTLAERLISAFPEIVRM